MRNASEIPLKEYFLTTPRNGIYKSKKYIGEGVKFVRMGDLFGSDFIDCVSDGYQLINLTDKEKAPVLLENNDLLFSRTSVVASGVGKCAMVRCDSNSEMVFDSNQIRIRLDESKASPLYFYYYFKSAIGRNKLLSLSGGAAVTTITGKGIANTSVPDINKKEQEKISDYLYKYDELIETNLKRIKLLEEMVQAIYTECFVNFRFSGHSKIKFVNSKTDFGDIPSDWKVTPIKNILEHYIGGGWGQEESSDDFTEPAYVIRGTDIPGVRKGGIASTPYRYHKVSNLKSRSMQKGDIVFEVSGGSKGQPLGRTCLLTKNLLGQFDAPVMCASFCKLMRTKSEEISPYYFYLLLNQWYKNGVIEKYQVQSTGISNFQFESFIDKESVIIPTEGIRKQFDEFIEPIFEQISILGAQNTKLREIRDLLIPKLVTGEIEIKA